MKYIYGRNRTLDWKISTIFNNTMNYSLEMQELCYVWQRVIRVNVCMWLALLHIRSRKCTEHSWRKGARCEKIFIMPAYVHITNGCLLPYSGFKIFCTGSWFPRKRELLCCYAQAKLTICKWSCWKIKVFHEQFVIWMPAYAAPELILILTRGGLNCGIFIYLCTKNNWLQKMSLWFKVEGQN